MASVETTVPGTTLAWPRETGDDAFSLLIPALSLSGGGLSLSQLSQLTGLTASGIQNWVKRGWVPHPVEKRYGRFQVARVLLLNLLRPAMQLERIVALLALLNGEVDDPHDDRLSEVTLYNMLCIGDTRLQQTPTADPAALEALALSLLEHYKVPPQKDIVTVLTLFLANMAAAQLIRWADRHNPVLSERSLSL